MSVKIDSREMSKQQEIKGSAHLDYSFIGLGDQSEIELKWIELHQMFDR